MSNDRRWCALLTAGSFALLTLVNLPFLSTYAVKGDDAPLLYASARQFSPSPGEWVTLGYKNYLVNFPEMDGVGSHFVRPVQNAVLYLESWLIPKPDSPLFLLTNYLVHGVAVGLVFLVARRLFRLDTRWSALAALLFFGTVATGELHGIGAVQGSLENSIAFGSDALSTVFALGALLVAHSHLKVRAAPGKVLAVVGLLTLAVFSKEGALVAPFVVAVYALVASWPTGREQRLFAAAGPAVRANLAFLGALSLPVVAFVVVRVNAGTGDNYILDHASARFGGLPVLALNPLRFFPTAFFPVETDTITRLIDRRDWLEVSFLLRSARAGAAIAVSLLIWGAVTYFLRRAEDRAPLPGLLAVALASAAIPVLVNADPRYTYFSQALMLPFLVLVVSRLGRRPTGAFAVPALVAVVIGIGPAYGLWQKVEGLGRQIEFNHELRQLQEGMGEVLADPNVKRLYFVNAHAKENLVGLRFYAALEGRRDVRMRIVNTMGGADVTTDPDAGISFALTADVLRLSVRLGPDQTLFGGGPPMSDEDLRRIRRSKAVSYGPITEVAHGRLGGQYVVQRQLEAAIPGGARDDYAVIGFDPVSAGIHLYRPGDREWLPVATLAGGPAGERH